MTRIKIDYGIDLGTTNSAIATMENGKPKIHKSDTLKDTIPSCIGFNRKKRIMIGDTAWNKLKTDKLEAMNSWDGDNYNVFIEIKRAMGTDRAYNSSNMEQEYNPEQLSAEILKKLRSFITDEDFQSVVITVPAKFDIRQKDATLRAAKIAGFQHTELLQEPIAASMTYGLDSENKNGYWIVFDFGGGTFDAALVKVEEGIMKVKDTVGDNYLGGKDLDMAIVNEVIIPYLKDEYTIDNILGNKAKKKILKEAMKYYAEEAKIQLSFKKEYNILSDLGAIPGEDDEGEEFELDITINRERLENVIAPVFQRAIDITKDLIRRNNLTNNKLDSLILVGGPTYSTILRDMLEEQIKKPDTSADPMTAVATGAALYASTQDVPDEIKEETRDKTKIQLDIGYESQTVEKEEWVTLKILPEKTEGNIPQKILAEIVRGDKAWSSGKVEINDNGEIIEAKLNEGKPNNFEVILYDENGNVLEGQPGNFTIIQGSIGGEAKLTHDIGIEIQSRAEDKSVFQLVKGLEQNVSLPATGTINGLKTQKQVRPGASEDAIKIPIYQGDHHSDGTRALYNKHVYDAKITGDNLPAFLPEGSDVDLTLTTDKSGRIEKIEAFFPYLDHTKKVQIPEVVESEIDAGYLDNEIKKAIGSLTELNSKPYINSRDIEDIKQEVDNLKQRLDQDWDESDNKQGILDNLRKSQKKIDKLSENIEWPELEDEIKEEFDRLKKADNEFGNEKTSAQVRQLRKEVDEVIRNKDVKFGQDLLEEIQSLYFSITLLYQLINYIRYHRENINSFSWKNPQKARQLISRGEQVIAENPTKERLHPIVIDLADELPAAEKGQSGVDDELLEK